ncbi:MAG: AIPR family protein, partial [Flavobacteriales bacterium]
MDLKKEINKYYKVFKGLPSANPIVRHNQENDAFEIFVYDMLFRNFVTELTKSNIDEISIKIVPPPDEGIDIFHEEVEGDEFQYHILQVKNTKLSAVEIKSCFDKMKRTVDLFYNDRKKVNKNLREIISNTNFDEDNENIIKYYVVHVGDIISINGQKDDEIIINIDELKTLYDGIKSKSVPSFEIAINSKSELLKYENKKSKKKSIICSLSASILAPLVKKYDNTELGRNILFGQNLREALRKGSKTYDGIKKTIIDEPHNFWYYNNGITIIAKELIIEDKKITLKEFSIINGAQTTSSFLQYLNEIEIDYPKKDRSKFSNKINEVFILARIVETMDDDQFKNKITLYNNTQNPISTRDMVSNNPEQIQLQKKLLNSDPNIYIDIRRGALRPKGIQVEKHRVVTNTELAQFIYSSVLQKPFIAKDKKNTIFNKDKNSKLINEYYDGIFEINTGAAFKLSVNEIDEILFAKELHKKAKQYISNYYNDELASINDRLKKEKDPDTISELKEDLRLYAKSKTINNVSMFYNLT